MQANARVKKTPNSGLDVERVTSQTIKSVHEQCVSLAYVRQQVCEPTTVSSKHTATHPFINELAVEATAKSLSLRLNALAFGRYPIIGDTAHIYLKR